MENDRVIDGNDIGGVSQLVDTASALTSLNTPVPGVEAALGGEELLRWKGMPTHMVERVHVQLHSLARQHRRLLGLQLYFIFYLHNFKVIIFYKKIEATKKSTFMQAS